MYITNDYYLSTFGGSVIPSELFVKYERQARVFLDGITFDRLKKDNTLIDDTVKECLCVIMECNFDLDNQGGIKSAESTNGVSVTYVVDQSQATEKAKYYKIAKEYLGNTDLLYRGVPTTIANECIYPFGGYYGY